MSRRSIGIFLCCAAIALAALLCVPSATDKYPDLRGRWDRTFVSRTLDPERAPLKPEYQKAYEAILADIANGRPGVLLSYVPYWCQRVDEGESYCLPQGRLMIMPMMMNNDYEPMWVDGIPETGYVLTTHSTPYRGIYTDRDRHLYTDGYRRIYTDGRGWPNPESHGPSFAGYSIGKWRDEDGDGKSDVLEVETRHLIAPHIIGAYYAETVIRERIYLDNADKNLLHFDVTLYHQALTQPWSTSRTYQRMCPNGRPCGRQWSRSAMMPTS